MPDQAVTWDNTTKGSNEPLWGATVEPWGLETPWQWDITNSKVDNEDQDPDYYLYLNV